MPPLAIKALPEPYFSVTVSLAEPCMMLYGMYFCRRKSHSILAIGVAQKKSEKWETLSTSVFSSS